MFHHEITDGYRPISNAVQNRSAQAVIAQLTQLELQFVYYSYLHDLTIDNNNNYNNNNIQTTKQSNIAIVNTSHCFHTDCIRIQ